MGRIVGREHTLLIVELPTEDLIQSKIDRQDKASRRAADKQNQVTYNGFFRKTLLLMLQIMCWA